MNMEVGVPLTRSTSPPSDPISSSSNLQAKKSFLSRLRRTPSTTSPYGEPIHAASTSAITTMKSTNMNGSSSTSQDKVIKKNQVGVPIMMGMNRSEEIFGPSTSIKHGFGIEDELEWERVRTLPRVRLVPPEEEQSEPIMLYPPPHMTRPSTPPPVLPHPFLSPPSSPPTSPTRLSNRPGSPPTSPPRRPQSIYSQSPTWAGMADGFVLPPPKFSRNSRGWSSTAFGNNQIVMPKNRAQVDEERKKRLSEINMDVVGSPPRSPPAIVVSGMMRSLESQEEIAANKRMRVEEDVKVDQPVIEEEQSSGLVLHDIDDLTASPVDMDVDQVPSPVSIPDNAPTSVDATPSVPVEPSSQPIVKPVTPASPSKPTPKAVRRSRALSLSAAFSSSSSLKNTEVPPLPDLPARPRIRKQKSLKKFFFSSSTPPDAIIATSLPPVPSVTLPLQERKSTNDIISNKDEKDKKEDKPSKGKKILQRARSKPSLKIDVKVAKPSSLSSASSANPSPTTPALTAGRTDISSAIDTPSSAAVAPSQPRGLSKRFSLSNMSQAFKKKSHSTPVSATSSCGSPIPIVPDLPEAYKKQKDSKGKIVESAVPLSPRKSKTLDTNKEEILTPTGLPRRSESLKAIQSLASLQDKALSTMEDEQNITSSNTLTEEPQSLLPAFEVPLSTSQPTVSSTSSWVKADSSSPVLSIKSLSTIDIDDTDIDIDIGIDGELEEDEHELIHAQLMHVSPRTRRDPSQSLSLQEFLSSPPGKTSNVVIVPTKGLRRSVEAVVMLGNPMFMNLQSPPASTLQTVEDKGENVIVDNVQSKRESKILERRGSETESEDELKTPFEDAVDFFPDQQEDEEPTPKASSSRTTQNPIENPSSTSQAEFNFDLGSLPSDIVLVETPPPIPSTLPFSTEQTTPIPNATSTPNKNRFVSPEGLLKRLHSSRKQQSTPYHTKKGSGSGSNNRESMLLFKDIPLPPIPTSNEFSSLSKEMQLRSLKFESLGLDFGDWTEEQLEQLIAASA